MLIVIQFRLFWTTSCLSIGNNLNPWLKAIFETKNCFHFSFENSNSKAAHLNTTSKTQILQFFSLQMQKNNLLIFTAVIVVAAVLIVVA
jgi:hypothetical protein